MDIRELNKEEIAPALDLVWKVFLEYEAPDYSQEGVDEFYKSIHNSNYLSMLTFYGAFSDSLVGVIATRNEGKHIALFFVDGRYQGQGIGRALFNAVKTDIMTVNSSPYAVPIYQKLGFYATNEEQVINGLRFIPMVLGD
ncbi:MAG: GNAT family N-acetyltransferase [Eubacterium sp.]|nr:GNAT family N-acetyltransferase [Eubacterium sp.]